jgi:hypothetical protein
MHTKVGILSEEVGLKPQNYPRFCAAGLDSGTEDRVRTIAYLHPMQWEVITGRHRLYSLALFYCVISMLLFPSF